MKKYILVLLLGGILITTTGCFNSKTLTCTSSTMDTGFKATTEIAVEFDGVDAKSLTLTHQNKWGTFYLIKLVFIVIKKPKQVIPPAIVCASVRSLPPLPRFLRT